MGKMGNPNKPNQCSSLAALAFALLAAGSGAFSCAPPAPTAKDKEVVKECTLADDQKATLSGRWLITPIPIAFHQDSGFAKDEIADIVAAADTWNEFAKSSMNIPLIDYGGDPVNPRMSASAKPPTLCAQNIVQGNQFSGQVVIYKVGRWPYVNYPKAMALTSYCPLPAKPIYTINMAIMELNYQNFFVAGKPSPDLRTIIFHEFGHLIGLDHSCDMEKANFPNCKSPTLNPAYFSALMYPVFGFDANGKGEQKRELTSNDQGRANCLYQQAP
ncbi:hypothetical protein WDW86_06595 [Bdellovibrionota bacterium FG-2]